MIMVMMVVLMVLIVVSVKSIELRQKQEAYAARIEQLQEQVEAENQRALEIEEYGKFSQTKKYVEEVALDKLGLVYEDEIIFKSEE